MSSLLFNCSKNDDEDNSLTEFMQAKVDGQLIVCNQTVNLHPHPNPYNNPHNGISGVTKDYPQYKIYLWFPIADGVGTYDLNNDHFLGSGISYYCNNPYDLGSGGSDGCLDRDYRVTTGSVTVTIASNSRYKGTFFFEADGSSGTQGSVSVTEGEFDIEY